MNISSLSGKIEKVSCKKTQPAWRGNRGYTPVKYCGTAAIFWDMKQRHVNIKQYTLLCKNRQG